MPRPRRSSGIRHIPARIASRGESSTQRLAVEQYATGHRRHDSTDRFGQLGASRADQAGNAEHLAAVDSQRDLGEGIATRADAVEVQPWLACACSRRLGAAAPPSIARPTIRRTRRSRVISPRWSTPVVAPVAQHNGTIGQRFDFLQTVRDVHDGRAARSQILQHREEAFGLARAEAGRRLVEHQQPRVHRKGASDRDQLLLRGGQPPHDGVRRDLCTNAGELPLRVCLHAPAIHQTQRPCPLRLAAEEDVAGDIQRLDDLALLMDDADAQTSRIRRSVHHHWHTLERDGARVSPMDAYRESSSTSTCPRRSRRRDPRSLQPPRGSPRHRGR